MADQNMYLPLASDPIPYSGPYSSDAYSNMYLPLASDPIPYSGPYSSDAYSTVNNNKGSDWAQTFDWEGVGNGLGGIFSGIGNLVAGTKGQGNTTIRPGGPTPPANAPQNKTIYYVIGGIVIVIVLAIGAYFIFKPKKQVA